MTVTREHYSDIGYDQLLAPVVRTTDVASTALDTNGFQSVTLGALIGASGDTLSGTVFLEVEVQESDTTTDGDFTAVANANLTNYVTGTNVGTIAVINAPAEASSIHVAGYKGTKRYVRLRFNLTGTHTNGIAVAGFATKGHAHIAPVNAST